jgi:hypothetical protein
MSKGKWKRKECRICEEYIPRKYPSELCSSCARTIYVNMSNMKVTVADPNTCGNPVILDDGGSCLLREGVYLVKDTGTDSVYFIDGNFGEDDIFNVKVDFTLEELKKAIEILEEVIPKEEEKCRKRILEGLNSR